jgi:transcriptional regulator NrdR family protein
MAFLCPECRARSLVVETRPAPHGHRRRYKCTNGHRFSTLEQPSTRPSGLGVGKSRPLKPDARAAARAAVIEEIRQALDAVEICD